MSTRIAGQNRRLLLKTLRWLDGRPEQELFAVSVRSSQWESTHADQVQLQTEAANCELKLRTASMQLKVNREGRLDLHSLT